MANLFWNTSDESKEKSISGVGKKKFNQKSFRQPTKTQKTDVESKNVNQTKN